MELGHTYTLYRVNQSHWHETHVFDIAMDTLSISPAKLLMALTDFSHFDAFAETWSL